MSSIIEVSSTSSISSEDAEEDPSPHPPSSPTDWLWTQLKDDGDDNYITARSLKRLLGDGVSDGVIERMLGGKEKMSREEFEAVYKACGIEVDEHGLPIQATTITTKSRYSQHVELWSTPLSPLVLQAPPGPPSDQS
ncbi:hypothetical protein FOZ62_010850 [Perkinsus olseni]|uniref:Uncharacterized protein n=1 Tax=Perkinsus olseni TaxID=32597 RepID=A0A7J6R6L4_PEROL|nr:hypothetical protein FOZ62_010850 [Perkinsus olseni]